jgi:hypothetical protein
VTPEAMSPDALTLVAKPKPLPGGGVVALDPAARNGTTTTFQCGKTETTPANTAVRAGTMGSTGCAGSLKQSAAAARNSTSSTFQCGKTETTPANTGSSEGQVDAPTQSADTAQDAPP